MILELVRSLRKRGVAIDGIGHQSHYDLGHSARGGARGHHPGVRRLGLRNHITELDVSLRERMGDPVPAVTAALQGPAGEALGRALPRCSAATRDKIDVVVLWGVNDETSWLRPPDEPLLFAAFRPKPAFWAVLDEATRKID